VIVWLATMAAALAVAAPTYAAQPLAAGAVLRLSELPPGYVFGQAN
jgi:hypothetical protein